MKLKPLVFALIGLVAVLVVVPFLIPMKTYLPQIENMVSRKTGVSVRIETLHIAVLPTPRLTLGGIVIGKDDEIRVKKVSAVLDVKTIFQPVRVVSTLEVQQPSVKQAALGIISGLAAQAGGPAPVVIQHIEVRDAGLEWPGMKLPTMHADIDLSSTGTFQQAKLDSTDGKIAVVAVPQGTGYAAHVTARQWTPPAGPPLAIDRLDADVHYAGQNLDVLNLKAVLYQGIMTASAHLNWKKDWRLAGKFQTVGVELEHASQLFTKAVHVSGRVTGNGSFASSAREPAQLADKLVLDYKFDVAKGVLYGMDLAKAASLFVKQGGSGGETQFDELTGDLHMIGKQTDLRHLNVVSGLIAASGGLKVSPAKVLDGQIDVELKKGLALVTAPLKISGTTDAPEVMPTKAAVAGAAAGTAVLGPLGTSLGMKAGSTLDRWFGGDKK